MGAGEWESEGEGWGRSFPLGEIVPLVCPCEWEERKGSLAEEEEDVDVEEGGRPRSCRMMQFLLGPECSPSWDGAFLLRSAAAAAASSRSFSMGLLGRPDAFLGLPMASGHTAAGFLRAARWPLPTEFSECTGPEGEGAQVFGDDNDVILKEELT